MKNDDYIQANRTMWNRTADVYRDEGFDKFLEKVGSADFTTFDEVERRVFAAIGLEGKDVAQLGCNNGRALISVKKAGLTVVSDLICPRTSSSRPRDSPR